MSIIQAQTQITAGQTLVKKPAFDVQVLAMVRNLPRMAWRVLKGWIAVRELSTLDAHMLADIGLTEADLLAARAVPLHQDPTQYLAFMSNARRCRGQGRNKAAIYISDLGNVVH